MDTNMSEQAIKEMLRSKSVNQFLEYIINFTEKAESIEEVRQEIERIQQLI